MNTLKLLCACTLQDVLQMIAEGRFSTVGPSGGVDQRGVRADAGVGAGALLLPRQAPGRRQGRVH